MIFIALDSTCVRIEHWLHQGHTAEELSWTPAAMDVYLEAFTGEDVLEELNGFSFGNLRSVEIDNLICEFELLSVLNRMIMEYST